jgi:hypothetical protein
MAGIMILHYSVGVLAGTYCALVTHVELELALVFVLPQLHQHQLISL